MITQGESVLHLCGAAALATAMLGVGLGVIGPKGLRRRRRLWIAAGAFGAAMTLFVANAEMRFSDDAMTLIAIGFAVSVGAIVGVVLVRLGVRGRRVGDHPHCRRCGFDLTGRPATSVACGECGAPLDAPRAIAIGAHERRPLPLLAGTFLALLSVAIGVAAARQIAMRPAGVWIRIKPASWLLADLSPPRVAVADQQEAMDELTRRLAGHELGAGDVKRFVTAATSGPAASPWGGSGDTPAMVAWLAGELDDATMSAIIKTYPAATLVVRPQSLPERVSVAITVGGLPTRTSPYTSVYPWTIEVVDRVDTINGTPVDPSAIVGRRDGPVSFTPFTPFAPRSPFASSSVPTPFGRGYRLKAPLPPGVATIAITMNVVATLTRPDGGSVSATVPITLTGTTTIVPADAIPPSAPDPRMDAARAMISNVTVIGGGRRPYLTVITNARDVDFTGDVFSRGPDGERLLGPIVVERGVGQMPLDAMPPDSFSLVFRPRVDRFEDLARPTLAYNREFVVAPDRIHRLDRRATTTRATTRNASRLAG